MTRVADCLYKAETLRTDSSFRRTAELPDREEYDRDRRNNSLERRPGRRAEKSRD